MRKNIYILFIFQTLLLIVSLVIAHESPAIGYESSIYESTPIIVWFSLITSAVLGITVVIFQIANKQIENIKLIFGFFLIYSVYIISLSLFIIRGYYGWALFGDPASHIGNINDILINGHISTNLFYPIAHIFTAQIYLLSNLDIRILYQLVPLFFGILYVPFMYIFAKSILPNKNQVLIATIASCTFIIGWYLNFTPNGLSNLFLPLFLYIFINTQKQNDYKWRILLLIVIFLYPLFHPVPTLFIIILILSSPISFKLFSSVRRYYATSSVNHYNYNIPNFKSILFIFLFVWGITWISSYSIWEGTIHNFYVLVIGNSSSNIEGAIKDLNTAQGFGYSVTTYIVKSFGSVFIYFFISILCLPIILKKMASGSDKYLNYLLQFYGTLFATILVILSLYGLNMAFGPLRMIIYITIISTIFVGFFLDWAIDKGKVQNKRWISKVVIVGTIILLVGIFINGTLLLYPSSYRLEANLQTTEKYFEGMSHFFGNRNISMEITGYYINPYGFSRLLSIPQKDMQSIHSRIPPDILVPYHFGYQNHSSLSEYYVNKNDLYLAITEQDKIIAKDAFPEIASFRWTLNDFEQLNFDSGLNKIYSNQGFDLYYIKTIKKW